MSITIGDTDIKDVYVGEGIDSYSAMQGPCSDGFHVPTSSEWSAVRTAGINMGAWTSSGSASITNIKNYLKIPLPGSRSEGSGSYDDMGNSFGEYWTCTRASYGNTALRFFIRNDSLYKEIFAPSISVKSQGLSIRPFKDEPVIPDSSWTVLYQGTGTSGIYRNSTLGLISISSDGTTRYTIADKNLGATTVYSNGASLSEANCGKFYQRGNNYGFPYSGSITTSSTQVNAQDYGPGNYYLSSTFIYRTTSPYGWDSSDNNDLRGGETGITKKGNVSAVYVGTTQVRPIPPNYLCFTANTANSTVKLARYYSNPPSVSLQISRDGATRSSYTIGSTISLSSIGDYVLFRSTSETDTTLSTSGNWIKFTMTGSIAGSGDVNFLLNKNSTDIASDFCFQRLFDGCTSLTTPPEFPANTLGNSCYSETFRGCANIVNAPSLPATTLKASCYYGMFYNCSNLQQLPALPALNIPTVYTYYEMFRGCSKIKLSKTQTGEYQTPYRIPTTGTGSGGVGSNMFTSTGGTFTGTPSINTTYYTSNEVV